MLTEISKFLNTFSELRSLIYCVKNRQDAQKTKKKVLHITKCAPRCGVYWIYSYITLGVGTKITDAPNIDIKNFLTQIVLFLTCPESELSHTAFPWTTHLFLNYMLKIWKLHYWAIYLWCKLSVYVYKKTITQIHIISKNLFIYSFFNLYCTKSMNENNCQRTVLHVINARVEAHFCI